jgi:hypothetical protein
MVDGSRVNGRLLGRGADSGCWEALRFSLLEYARGVEYKIKTR